MSNLGLLQAMEREVTHVRQTAGDPVLEEMRAGGFSLGGEQSGHVILLDHGTTGDGVLTGLLLAARVVASGRSIAGFRRHEPPSAGAPQRPGCRQEPVRVTTTLRAAARDEQAALDGSGESCHGRDRAARARHGRGADPQHADEAAARLAGVVRERLPSEPIRLEWCISVRPADDQACPSLAPARHVPVTLTGPR